MDWIQRARYYLTLVFLISLVVAVLGQIAGIALRNASLLHLFGQLL